METKQEIKCNEKKITVYVTFVGIDGWNRPIFKSIKKPFQFYGDTCNIFNSNATEQEVLKKIDVDNLTYFGDHFGCEPCGSVAGNIKIIK